VIRIAFAFVALLLSFAAPARENPVPDPLGTTLPVDIVLSQTQLAVDLPDQSTGVTGLPDAIVQVLVEKHVDRAGKRVASLHELLSDFRFGESIETAMRSRLASEGLATAPELKVLHGTRFSTAPPGGALLLYPTLAVSADFERIVVRMTAIYLYRAVDAKGREHPARLGRDYSYALTLRDADRTSATEDAARWAGLGREELTALLDLAAGQVGDMLAYDFSPAGRLESAKPMPAEAWAKFDGKTYGARAQRRTDRSVWLRYGKGSGRKIDGIYLVGDRPELTAVTVPAAATAAPAQP
jgi:hypothetical protein